VAMTAIDTALLLMLHCSHAQTKLFEDEQFIEPWFYWTQHVVLSLLVCWF